MITNNMKDIALQFLELLQDILEGGDRAIARAMHIDDVSKMYRSADSLLVPELNGSSSCSEGMTVIPRSSTEACPILNVCILQQEVSDELRGKRSAKDTRC
mmetsp:Transcript_8919/g.29820  ORF Transcript_8919/g.29820 Transcript_8919/m.29820 type:complete len:101 (+) Transcript_8919:758-1060(+)